MDQGAYGKHLEPLRNWLSDRRRPGRVVLFDGLARDGCAGAVRLPDAVKAALRKLRSSRRLSRQFAQELLSAWPAHPCTLGRAPARLGGRPLWPSPPPAPFPASPE